MSLVMKLPCGCESRKEIMTSGQWKTDAIIVGGVILLACCAMGGRKLIK